MKDEFAVKEEVINALAQAVQRGGRSLGSVPGLLRRIIDEELWQERINPLGEHIAITDFRQFIEAPYPNGLGTTVETLEALSSHEPVILDYLAAIQQGKPGRPIGSTNTSKLQVDANGNLIDSEKITDIVRNKSPQKKQYGNSAIAALNRLRSARPDLHKQILEGKLTPNAAMIEAGFRKKKVSVTLGDISSTAKTLLKKLEKDKARELIEELLRGIESEE